MSRFKEFWVSLPGSRGFKMFYSSIVIAFLLLSMVRCHDSYRQEAWWREVCEIDPGMEGCRGY